MDELVLELGSLLYFNGETESFYVFFAEFDEAV